MSDVIFLKSPATKIYLSKETVAAAITYFETKLKLTLKARHRERFLNRKFESLHMLERQLAAYRVFGDLGYGR